MQPVVFFEDLGFQSYRQVWDYQESLLQQNTQLKLTGEGASTRHHLLLVEHPPVYTLGKSGKMENLLWTEDEIKKREIEFFHINRGGDITFHGPGQIVGYPILDLEKMKPDLGWYLRGLEEMIILTLSDYGLTGGRSKGETGVWLDAGIPGKERKICAMGIKCSRWITMHGFAFNVHTDLAYFEGIVPCGIQNKAVTSLQKELNGPVSIAEVKERLKNNFESVFNCRLVDEVKINSVCS
ncbi:MAG: lipoyl(octanoyl) transferase LipB [Chitinophagaceae bacterium]|nr:lipoyl(octanoyl) transferase LipB [Chitinophagaceae bacterium]MCA6471563.1 lipoyl(octanoyl) transferase LipB [Chitinophagaceae bacterium]MCA6476700.1 lipoyl(octanoyl) transferase LipB [Chitinophagaceae bacterium]MCA6478999.1 lipoyl(octanoyl) transferase LipB [Chitinophagaceae bacterium]MCA6491699.1 lipoyl(octanoyl) transferase LipB [Chitinophagaceae bacterium]